MEKTRKFLKLAIFAQLGACIGRVLAKYLHYAQHPTWYEWQSAPWYTGILVTLAVTFVTVTLTTLAYFLLGRYIKKRNGEPNGSAEE